jgi:hypothetical protein
MAPHQSAKAAVVGMTVCGEQRFGRGSHLKVFRGAYFHHGVYDNDHRVFEFGGRIWDKPNARIRVVTLAQFENGGKAHEVKHPGMTLVGPLPPSVAPEEIIMRAEFLADVTPKGKYNVVGFNCETAANWCVCGGYSESHQTRTVFLVSATTALYGIYRKSRDGHYPRWFVYSRIASPIAVTTYHLTIRAFWRDIGNQWVDYRKGREN